MPSQVEASITQRRRSLSWWGLQRRRPGDGHHRKIPAAMDTTTASRDPASVTSETQADGSGSFHVTDAHAKPWGGAPEGRLAQKSVNANFVPMRQVVASLQSAGSPASQRQSKGLKTAKSLIISDDRVGSAGSIAFTDKERTRGTGWLPNDAPKRKISTGGQDEQHGTISKHNLKKQYTKGSPILSRVGSTAFAATCVDPDISVAGSLTATDHARHMQSHITHLPIDGASGPSRLRPFVPIFRLGASFGIHPVPRVLSLSVNAMLPADPTRSSLIIRLLAVFSPLLCLCDAGLPADCKEATTCLIGTKFAFTLFCASRPSGAPPHGLACASVT